MTERESVEEKWGSRKAQMVFVWMDKSKHKNLQTEILTGYIVNHFPLLPTSSEEVFLDVAEEQHNRASP